jgi:RHS repeat-associated protein
VIGVLSLSLLAFGANGNLVAANAAHKPRPGHGPNQESGTAAGRGHSVDPDTTRAHGGNGRERRHAKGELGDFAWQHPAVQPYPTGPRRAGFDESTRKRLPEKSGARMDLYTDAGGHLQGRYSAARVNFKNAQGDWTPIDTTLTHRSGQFTTSSFEGRFGGTADVPRYSETSNDVDVEVAGRSNDPSLIILGPDGTHSVTQSLSGAGPSTGTVKGSEITYTDALTDTDLIITALAEGFRDTLLLKTANAPTTFTFPLALNGLTAKINDGGGIEYLDANGTVVASSPHGHMNDSKTDETGEGTRSQGVTYGLVTVDGNPAIQIDLDAGWLHDPTRKFPVQVDPATYTELGDTYLDSTTNGTDHSGDTSMGMGIPSSNRVARSYIKFTLPDTLPGYAVHTQSATLHLWLTYVTTCSATAIPFEVRSVRSAFTPGSGMTTWSTTTPTPGNTILGTGSTVVNTGDPPCNNSPVNTAKGKNVDVALGVNANMGTFDTWAPNNYGLMLKAQDETVPYNGTTFTWKRFDTDQVAANPSCPLTCAHPPSLDIVYAGNTAPQIDSRSVGSLNSLIPELRASAHDADGFPNTALQFQFKIFNAGTNPNATSPAPTPVVDSGRIAIDHWFVPAGLLSWGTDYIWTVQAWDGYDLGPPNGALVPKPFTLSVRQPAIGSTLTKAAGEHGYDSNTGNLTTTGTDANVTTIGPALAIKRSYNSRDTRTGGLFGAAWSSQLDMTLTELKGPSGASVTGAVLTYDDGQQAGFDKDAGGTFTPGEGFFGTLTPISGGYTYTDNTATTWTFTQARAGQSGVYGLTKVVDGTNYQLSYTWTGDRITKATTASGRSLTFTWTTPSAGYSAHVATVITDRAVASDPNSALVWTYTYSGDRLMKVCPPISSTACTAYAYRDGSHYPTVVLDSRPYDYWRLNDPAPGGSPGVALDSVVDNEGATNATSTAGLTTTPSPIANGTATGMTFNGSSTYVTAPPDLNYNLYNNSISLWFKTTTADRVLMGWHDDALSVGTATGSYVPDLYIGSDGKLRGQLGWGGAGRPITTAGAVTDGQWHQVVLTSYYPTATLTMYLDGTKAGTRNQAGYIWRPANYDPTRTPQYLPTLTIGAGYIGSGWPGTTHTSTAVATYFAGSISDVAIHTRPLTPAEVSAAYNQAKAGPAALLTSVTTAAGHTALNIPATYTIPLPPGGSGSPVTVNGWDVVRDAVQAVTDANGGTWAVAAPTVSGSSTGLVGAVRAANPLAYWRVGEEVGTQAVEDSQDFNKFAEYSNVTLAAAPGPFGVGDSYAAGFDGTVSQINAPTTNAIDLANRAANSLSMWFQTPANGPGGMLFGYAAAPVGSGTVSSAVSYAQALYVGTDGYLYGSMWNGTVNPIVSTVKVNDGAWHQATLTNAGTSGKQYLYVDGSPVSAAGTPVSRNGGGALSGVNNDTFGAGFAGRSWPAQPYGASSLGTPWRFKGNLAEISVYTNALTSSQVLAQYQAQSRSKTAYPIKTITVTDPLGYPITDRYDPNHLDRILSHTDSLGHTATMGYDTRGFQNAVTDGNGNSMNSGHDTRSNVVSQTVCQDQATDSCSSLTYVIPAYSAALGAANDEPTSRLAPPQNSSDPASMYQTDLTYNALGEPLQVKEPTADGVRPTTSYTYTDSNTVAVDGGTPPVGLPLTMTDPANKVTSYTYYADGDTASVTNPLGLITRYSYDGLGRILTSTEVSDTYPSGLTTTFSYDGLGRTVTQISPNVTDGVTSAVHTPTTTTVYDADSFVTSTTVSDGATGGDRSRTTTNVADSQGRLASTTDATGATTFYDYDKYGNRISVTAPDGTVTVSAYDSLGRLLTTTLQNYTGDPSHPGTSNLITHSFAYDFSGRMSSDTDAMGWSDLFTYFDDGRTATHIRTSAAPAATAPFWPYNPGTCMLTATGARDNANCFVVEADTYDGAGNLSTQITNNGATTTKYTYDALGRQASATLDPDGLARVTKTTYSASNYVTNITLTGGGATQSIDYTVDPMGNQLSRTVNDSSPKTTTWTRDKRGLITSMVDPLGNATNPVTAGHETDYLNDEAGHQVAVIAPSVATESGVEGVSPLTLTPITRTGYNTFGEAVSTQDANNNRTYTDNDVAHRLLRVTNPVYTPPGGTAITPATVSAYDALGRVLDETDALGNHLTHTWSQLGFELTRTLPGATTTTMTYDSLGDLLSTTTPSGARTESTWDFRGRKVTDTAIERTATDKPCAPPATSPSCYITNYAYDSGGWLAKQTTAAGVVTTYTYDAAGERASMLEVTDVVNGTGNKTTYAYDLAGRLASTTLPDNTSHKVSYDVSGNQIGTTDTDQSGAVLRSTSATFDLNDRQISSTDARGNQTTWTRDTGGTVTAQSEPVAGGSTIVTSYAHDPRGNQTRFTDGRGNPFLTTYNPWNLPETRVEPATPAHPGAADRTWTIAYDAMARIVAKSAPGGVSTTRHYDARGNLDAQTGTGAEATTVSRSFHFDSDNRMDIASAPGGQDTFTYDDRGDLTNANGGSGNASFTYNPDARMTTRADAAGTSNYAWDVAGRLGSIKDAATAITATRGYDSTDQLKTVTYGSGGAVRTMGYDDLHRITGDTLTAPGGLTEASISYGYDKNDNETSKTTAGLAGSANNTYTYDASDRLTSWNDGSATTNYTFDASGNRTGIGSRTQTFDARNRITSASDGTTTVNYTWTPRGTLAATTGGATRTVTYDAFDQIATDTAAAGSAGTGTQAYTYDALARQITAGPSGTGTGPSNTLVYSGVGNDLAADSTTFYALDPDGGQVATKNGTTGALALNDRHDDVVAAFTPTGSAVAGSRAYDPLGKTIASTGTIQGQQGFQGDWTDPATGQVDMWHRAYDPTSGLFDSRDSTDNAPDPNSGAADRYTYGDDNPLTMVDPTGFISAIPASMRPWIVGTNGGGRILVKIPYQPDRNTFGYYYAWIPPNTGGLAYYGSTVPGAPNVPGAFRLGRQGGGFLVSSQFQQQMNRVQNYNNNVIDAAHSGVTAGQAFDALIISRSCFSHFNASCAVQAALLAAPFAGRALEGTAVAARVLEDAGPVERRLATTCLHSFAPATPVLRADGSAVPISRIKVGDKVKATDPATGRSTDRAVTAVMVHRDDDLLDVTVHNANGSNSVIHATAHHPFWDDTQHGWTDAANLHQGDRLHAPDGSVVTVAALTPIPGTANMWDLTVDDDHDFYVTATPTDGTQGPAVLVHNMGGPGIGCGILRINKEFQFGGAGRSGKNVKHFVGPPNSVVRGASDGRIFVTDDQGRVILDITKDRAKPVVPGRGFESGSGRKLTPTPTQLRWIKELWG